MWSAALICGLLLMTLVGVRCVYGGGEAYPDVSTEATLGADRLEALAELEFPAGNVTSSPDGRIFFTIHPFANPERFTDAFLFEWVDGKPLPYPSAEVQSEFVGALGLTADRHDRLWMIRPAGIEDRKTRLFAFDLDTGERVVDYAFADGTAPFAQDLRVSFDGKTVVLADTGVFRFTEAALIVFDVESKTARRVLQSHPSVSPQNWVIQANDEPYQVFYGLVTFSVGVDGLAMSHDGKWLYYATMSHDSVFKVPLDALRDSSSNPSDLAAAVQRVGPKPLSDGIEIDADETVYITDVEHGGLARLSADGTLTTLVRSKDVVWADGINLTASGDVLFTDSKIPRYIDPLLRPPSREEVDAAGPHRIYRVRLE